MQAFTGIDQRLKVHLTYAHVFGDGLTEAELVRCCEPADHELVRESLTALESRGLLDRLDGYYFLAGHAVEGRASTVSEGLRRVEEILRENRAVLRLIARLPWVRLLAVSGSLARNNPRAVPGKTLDIDLFVITEPSSLHVVRLILRIVTSMRMLAARVRGAPPPRHLCLNYMTEASFPEIANPSLFTASEAIHVRVLKNPEEHRRFLAANPWIARYYPIPAEPPTGQDVGRRPGARRAAANFFCFLAMATGHWVKATLHRRGFVYSIRPRHDRTCSLRRVSQVGGGYQCQIAASFRRAYRHHFGIDEELECFLFPDTTSTGIFLDGEHYLSASPSLAFDE